MLITYAVEHECEPRQQLGDLRLAELVATDHALVRRPLAAPCRDCPANALERPMGCFGTVQLPLAAADERWLLDRLPRDLSTTAGYTLHSALIDFGWDGGYAARLRAADRERVARGESLMHFESEQAILRDEAGRYRDERRGEAPSTRSDGRNERLDVDSNQAFDMLFGEGHVQAAHPLLLCLFFGLLPHDISPADLGVLSTDPSSLPNRVILPAPDRDLARALRAVAAAAALGRQFLIQS